MNETITKIQIKDCTLYHADCIDVFDEIGKVDVVITDPPYGIGIAKTGIVNESKMPRMGKKKLMPHLNIDYGIQTWDKKNGNSDAADCELIWTSFKNAVRKIEFKWCGFWQGDMKNKEKRYHPTQKPQYVMQWIIDKYTKETDLILDPFMGSGSTGVACVIGGRKFIGIEKEKQYFDIACKRVRWACKQNALF